VVEAKRRKPGPVLVAPVKALGAELVQCRVHVDRIPEHDSVHHQTQGPELVLLPFAVTLPQFAALAVEDDTGELVAALAAVQLDQDAPAIGFIVDEAKKVERLDQPAECKVASNNDPAPNGT
jgi:hypothetical protein